MSVEQELNDAVLIIVDSEDVDRVAAIFKAEQGYYAVNTGRIWETGDEDGIDWGKPFTVEGYNTALEIIKDVMEREWKQ